ncbi:MAG: phosphoenolpyruvate--protein phosphotransferase [Gammaproteobacteria bacterium]|nr:phosphoenolpyruvate--protein phosphotransferase [Gammaproteobacteria bacterium]
MLDVLSQITQKVSMANDLNEALAIIVTKVQKNIEADVCSVYLQNDQNEEEFVLMATIGLNPSCVGKVILSAGSGLVGLVAQKGDPVNIAQAQKHPAFRVFQELQETAYNGFAAIPIINHKKILGVLVVQSQQSKKFSQETIDFLLTITSQLSSSILHAKAIDRLPVNSVSSINSDRPIIGSPVSPGVAIGQASLVISSQHLGLVPNHQNKVVEDEIKLFMSAVDEVKKELKALSEELENDNLLKEDVAIFDAYIMMLDSKSFISKTLNYIRSGNWAPGALRQTIEEYVDLFEAMENRYMQERVKDLCDLGQSVLNKMLGSEEKIDFNEQSILVAEDFSAMTLSKITSKNVKGIISVKGSGTSHIAIIARALGIPTVMGLSDIPLRRLNDCQLIVDGYSGKVFISPSEAIFKEYRQFEKEEIQLSKSLQVLKDKKAETKDGVVIPLYVNLGLEEGISSAKDTGAEGVGLFRTEFPFMISKQFPGEQEQTPIYRSVLKSFAPNPVVLRTLDIGGDKTLPYFHISEENPFLGWRGIRISLDHPEIFMIQLKAMIIASEHSNNLHIMLPMVSTLSEIEEAKLLIIRVYAELVSQNYQVALPKIGVMIEVPSLIFQVNDIVKRVDFLSIGTNDLIQYLLAVDRNNSQVADLYQSLHPAVLKAMNQIIISGRDHGLPVSVCGEMASDPLATILLLGMGVSSLSTNIAALPRVKWVIREFSQKEARHILAHVLQLSDTILIRDYLEDKLEEKGLAGLIRAGK